MSDQPDAQQPRRHLIIAGTGRAGTTFLVRYLTALGLDTHLSRRGDAAWTDDQAQAGLEDFPLDPTATDLPYLIKNPMLHEFIDQVLESPDIHVDGVIIPIRNLREATSSRVILERRSMYEHLPWLQFMDKAWDTGANVAGGLIFSLSALDEARTLAMGLHLLIERLVHANVPFVFLDFPRIVEDADYLYAQLTPFLPAGTTADSAARAHAEFADPGMVRVEREARPADPAAVPLDDQLDRLALLRELQRLRAVNAELTAGKAEAENAEMLRYRSQIYDLETARARAVDSAMELRKQLREHDDRYRELLERQGELSRAFVLAMEQLEGLPARADAEWQRHWERDNRTRVASSERAVYDLLGEFADDLASIADRSDASLQVAQLRSGFAALLAQLEAANAEIATLSERLDRNDSLTNAMYAARNVARRVRARLPQKQNSARS